VSTAESRPRGLRIAIIGAGPGGICMAIRLQQAGFTAFVLLEKTGGVGGTW
jgi:cation diffusion facilitator CzcD-associated flavoprotein CzcO